MDFWKFFCHLFLQPPVKTGILILSMILFIAYFCAAMIINNPFGFPQNLDQNTIITNYIFSNNTSKFQKQIPFQISKKTRAYFF